MKLFLAPIQSITLAHYRNLYNKIFGGIDGYYAPFISTTDINKSNISLFQDIFPENNDDDLYIIPQLLGSNGVHFRDYAQIIVNLGYREINWNIGCPFHTVTKKMKGSGILPYPDKIKEFLDIVCKDSSYDLTVKMRLGWDNLDEGIEVVELLNQYPLKGVIIHGRTGVQKYEGTVDLNSFDTLNSLCKHEITYNGDIFSIEDFNHISKRFSTVNNFMLGRGALRNPLLASEIKNVNISSSEKISKLRTFHDSFYDYYKEYHTAEKFLCNKMKEFWTYTSYFIDPTGEYIKRIKKSHTSAVYLNIVDELFDSIK